MQYKNLTISWLGHAGFRIKDKNNVIYIDPFQLPNENYENEKADIIFITHSHYDHCSIEDIKKIMKSDSLVICTSDVQSKIRKVGDNIQVKIIEPGMSFKISGINVKTVNAYNIGKSFHPKNNYWVGYIIEINGSKIYHAGDTDVIPEMNIIKSNIILLPVGGTYTMNSYEAAKAAEIIKPEIAIPMHWGSIIGSRKDAEVFVNECIKLGINSEILEKE